MAESEKPKDLTAEQKAQHESNKLLFDVYKHITTLSSGSIVLLTAFLEKLFKSPKEAELVVLSLACLFISMVTSLPIMAHVAVEQQLNRNSGRLEKHSRRLFYWLSPMLFILGILCLTLFCIINLKYQAK
jgi:hypothetical protein